MGSILITPGKIRSHDQLQEVVKSYWDLKKSVEDQTIRFLRCVDILESALAHILSCDEKNSGHQDKKFSFNPQASQLLHSSLVTESGEKQSFVNEFDNFVEFISKQVGQLQTDYYETCGIQSKYSTQQIDSESLNKNAEYIENAGDAFKEIIKDLRMKIDYRDVMIKALKKENEVLHAIFKSQERDEKTYEYSEQTLQRFKALKNENETLKKKLNDLEQENIGYGSILKQTQAELNKCSSEKQIVEHDTIQVQEILTQCQMVKKETELNLNAAYTNLEKREHECGQLKSNLEQIVKEKNATDEKLAQAYRDLKSTERQLDEANQDLRSTKTQYLSLQSLYSALEQDCSTNVRDLENNVKKLKEDLQMCHSKNNALSNELTFLNSKKYIKVKLFAIRRPTTLAVFEDALVAMLKSRIDDDVRELVFEQNDDPDVVNTDTDPTIVLCLCGSRIESNAVKAVEGLTLSPKMALVMIHYKDVHALPTQLSERVITGPEYKKLHLITDMAFLRDKGIYPCDINNNSVVKLVNFMKTEGKEYKKY